MAADLARRPDQRERLAVAQAWPRSPRVYDGWSPAYETLYEYEVGADGETTDRLVRSVTRQIESEWDDDSRALVEGLALHDAQLCSGCKMHPVILADPERYQFTIEERVCEFCASEDQYGRVIAAKDETWHKTNPEPGPAKKQPGDGRHLIVRPKTAEEIEAEKARKAAKRRAQRNPRRKEGT